MKKLLNTLYVTSENSYLGLDGENIVVFEDNKEKGRLPFYDTAGKISCSSKWKDKRKCASEGTAVCKLFGFCNQPGNCKKLYTWKGI